MTDNNDNGNGNGGEIVERVQVGVKFTEDELAGLRRVTCTTTNAAAVYAAACQWLRIQSGLDGDGLHG